MRAHNLRHAFAGRGQNIQPHQHGPEAVFFTHMIGARARAFFAADRDLASIQQIAEIFPARGRFKGRLAQRFGHNIGGATGRHGPRHACNPVWIARRDMRIGGNHGEAIRGADILARAQHDIAVPIAVTGRAKIWRIRAIHFIE